MLLSKYLADQIVQGAMSVIFHNVNVILPNGVIFASGDKARIGKIHEPGRKAALDKKRVNIYPEEANLFKGVAPGINQPIIVDDEVQLVIGVTGNPNEISRYAELAFLTAKLLINQAIVNDAENRKIILRDAAFSSLVFNERHDLDDCTQNDLSAFLSLPKFIYLVLAERSSGSQEVVCEVIDKLKKLPLNSEILILTPNIFIILNDDISAFIKQKELLANIAIRKENHFRVGKYESISSNIKNFNLLASIVRSGIRSLSEEKFTILDPFLSVIDFDSASYILDLVLNKIAKYDVFNSFKLFIESNIQRDNLIETVKAYIEEDQEVSRTAERLHIHRNTIQKRFDSIKQLSGFDPTRFKDLMLFYLVMDSRAKS